MRKITRIALGLAVGVLAIGLGQANASFIGDEIQVDITEIGAGPFTDIVTVGGGVEIVGVNGAGTPGTFANFLLIGESVDFGATSIELTFLEGIQFTMTVSDIAGVVTGVSVGSNTNSDFYDFGNLFIAPDGHSFSFGYIGYQVGPPEPSSGVLNITFADGPNPSDVPEPSTILLFGCALAGLGLVRRRKLS